MDRETQDKKGEEYRKREKKKEKRSGELTVSVDGLLHTSDRGSLGGAAH